MKLKKFIATTLAVGVIACSGAAFANENALISPAPVVNGATIASVGINDINGVRMMPLRYVAEGLGYTVNWNDESQSIDLIKGSQFITMSIGADSYAFSRRAPQALGAAPVLYNDTVTYVPLSFISEIVNGYYSVNEDGSYKVVIPYSVTVSAVEEGSLLVTDNVNGSEVIVFVDENTNITDGTNDMGFADIKIGMVLGVEYGDAMTASLPPQTTAVKIIIENVVEGTEEAPKSGVEFSGEITEVIDNMVIIGTPGKDTDAIALVISEETVISKGNDKRIYSIDDLTVGTKISGVRSEAATFSIPPQSHALTVNIAD